MSGLRPQVIHVALPCGTGSRARERPLPKHLIAQGAPQPRPLRDDRHPLGLPNLRPLEQVKVQVANALASFAIDLLALAVSSGTMLSIENPENSRMWPVLRHFAQRHPHPRVAAAWEAMTVTTFSNCAHGGDRPKPTSLRCTHAVLGSLAAPCPGHHDHKPYAIARGVHGWKFDTALEAEYPCLLCQRLSRAFRAPLQAQHNFQILDPPAAGHTQSKRSRALIPEYHHIAKSPPTLPHKLLPPHHGGQRNGEEAEGDAFGVYHTPKQFVSLAERLTHPFDNQFVVDDQTKRNLFDLLTGGIARVAQTRLNFAKKLAAMRQELRAEEARFLAAQPAHAQRVLAGKNLLLFKALLAETGCPDLGAFDLMLGLDLIGVPSKSAFFDTKLVPATSTQRFALTGSGSVWRGETSTQRTRASQSCCGKRP